jgi:hypothetical protein
LLTKDDAKAAEKLEQQIEEFTSAGNYTAAIKPATGLPALRIQVQGADHWQVTAQKHSIQTPQIIAALPTEKQEGWIAALLPHRFSAGYVL